MSDTTQLSIYSDPKAIAEIKNLFAAGVSDTEFQLFLQLGKAAGLNPFLREIYAIPYGGKAQIFISRDGYRKIAQANPDYDYHYTGPVYSNDEFSVDNGEIKHKFSSQGRGEVVGAYCVVKRKSASKSVYVFVSYSEYVQEKSPIWKTKPATMIQKVAEAHGLRMAFANSALQGTYNEGEDWHEETRTVEPKDNLSIYKEAELAWRNLMISKHGLTYDEKKGEQLLAATLESHFQIKDLTKLNEDQLKSFVMKCKEQLEQAANA